MSENNLCVCLCQLRETLPYRHAHALFMKICGFYFYAFLLKSQLLIIIVISQLFLKFEYLGLNNSYKFNLLAAMRKWNVNLQRRYYLIYFLLFLWPFLCICTLKFCMKPERFLKYKYLESCNEHEVSTGKILVENCLLSSNTLQ